MARFVVGAWEFPSKKALLGRLQERLHQTPIGSSVPGEDGAILKVLLSEHHHHAAEKVGPGIANIVVGTDFFGGRNYQVVRVDGTREPFSYRKTISKPRPKTVHRARMSRAFRQEVVEQTQAAKAQAVNLSENPLEWDTTDIDHVGVEFAELVELFLADHGLSLSRLVYTESPEGDRFFLADRTVAQQWQNWHQQKAKLVALHRDTHRSKNGAAAKPLDETYMKGSARLRPALPTDTDDLDKILSFLD